MSKKKQAIDTQGIWVVLKRVVRENARDHIKGYAFAIGCLVTISGSTAFTAWIMKTVVDEAFAKQRADIIWVVCLSLLSAFVLRGFATYGQAVALSKISNNIVARYQRRVFAHLMTLSSSFYAEARSARIAAQLNGNIGGIAGILNLTVTTAARDFLSLIGLIGVMIVQDPVLSFFVLIFAPILLFGIRYLSKRLRTASRESTLVGAQVFGAMQETIAGIAIVKAFTMEPQLQSKIDKLIDWSENRANRIARLSERTAPLTDTFAGIAIASVLAYSAYRSIYFHVLPGAFFSFVTALLMAYDPARRLARVQLSFERAAVNASMLYEVLDMEPPQRDKDGAKALVVDKATVEFRDVCFSYSDGGRMILDNVSFTAEGGKTTALVGPSGAGKSTVINLVPRFFDPVSGAVLIDGQNIADITKVSLRHSLAYVSQQPYLFEGSIRDNIRYGRPDATDAEVEEAARHAYAHDFIMQQENGYDTPLGENGVTLSGGQRQRLSIARAIVRNAPILLLDEATSALDTESEAAVQKALDVAMSGRTVIVIAHRLSTIADADKIVVMNDGRVIEEGTHETLARQDNGLYARLNSLQLDALGLQAD
ncbi:ABC transporter ATP-binding protein [Rhizobium sp. NRK18]|uniref:ABC transporter ATP-binding protein n=1 Tax=Rhizobium sp. NRK18 TaxID=2964667 RepID=UPI0021C33C5E|nr:ABC transporter ATP-binding protein [Rhizobium sp. NRK18]MCQ2005806.1 ABC transporter ATP-binding protein/permease [Rhizobium sp. NRK18]